ncbi:PepSY domain-containing protein [Labilibaculum sp.]|uniref:PepSY domain-containing protein n=1 Tax=Labilibaculum sp. TaxID=2060723 RepID=UPI0035654AB2
MSKLKKLLLQIHDLSGSLLSLMFVIWFLSGFVLIYAGFPHASREERFMHLSFLEQSDFNSIQMPSNLSGRLELEKRSGIPVYRAYKGRKSQKVYNAISLAEWKKCSEKEALALAEDFVGAKTLAVQKIDELDEWIPYSYYHVLLPMYKISLDDEEHTRLYISEKSGSIVQETTRASRWAARVGAIPHWVYLRSLYQQKAFGATLVTSLAFIGILASLSGLIVGFIRLRKRKKGEKKQWQAFTPYKKFWYKWHHISGFVFGFFVFTFILSGLVSLTSIPKWMVSVHAKVSPQKVWNQSPDLRQFSEITMSDFWYALDNKKEIRKVVFKSVMGKPCFWLYRNHFQTAEIYSVEEQGIHRKEHYSGEEVRQWCEKSFPEVAYDLQEQKEYDAYYQPTGMATRPLPVWQINLKDADHTRLYVSSNSGELLKSYNSNQRWRRWSYRSLHALDFPFLKQHEWLRKLILIVILIGGSAVSISGFVLGMLSIKRKCKKRKK